MNLTAMMKQKTLKPPADLDSKPALLKRKPAMKSSAPNGLMQRLTGKC